MKTIRIIINSPLKNLLLIFKISIIQKLTIKSLKINLHLEKITILKIKLIIAKYKSRLLSKKTISLVLNQSQLNLQDIMGLG
jgi:hypothetical protein